MNGQNTYINRRNFIRKALWGTATLVTGISGWRFTSLLQASLQKNKIKTQIVGASAAMGHQLRSGKFPPPSQTRNLGCVIVGGGMAGLSAAWRLQKKGMTDFTLLELEKNVGGNAQSGKNEVSAFPWGAHYVPIPNDDSHAVRELFEELGVIEGYDSHHLPIYHEPYLCAEPQERLFFRGRWQEGLVPQFGLSPTDLLQQKQFFDQMEYFRMAKGKDGRRAFTIPLEQSSEDPQFVSLDQITMADYLKANHWDSEYLSWYVNYCCRDDFGTPSNQVSAWAGIHYFAARNGRAANAPPQSVLTWPEGNGWLVQQLRAKLQPFIRTQYLVFSVSQKKPNEVWVDALDLESNQSIRFVAESVIFAAPRFIAPHVIEHFKERYSTEHFTYAPWMVANITVHSLPTGDGAPLSWDNVSYRSPSLGYVVARHQVIERYPSPQTVLTYYLPLSDHDPAQERKSALATSPQEWEQKIIADLESMHPGIHNTIRTIDVWLWGHGMIRPTPGFISSKERKMAKQPMRNIHFAHSDLSGMSIFEEAQYWGITAADQVCSRRST